MLKNLILLLQERGYVFKQVCEYGSRNGGTLCDLAVTETERPPPAWVLAGLIVWSYFVFFLALLQKIGEMGYAYYQESKEIKKKRTQSVNGLDLPQPSSMRDRTQSSLANVGIAFHLFQRAVSVEADSQYQNAVDTYRAAASHLNAATSNSADEGTQFAQLTKQKAEFANKRSDALEAWIQDETMDFPAAELVFAKRKMTHLIEGHSKYARFPRSNQHVRLSRAVFEDISHTHYTAVTCPANKFTESGYVMRSNRDSKQKNMMVAITCYNEPASQLFGTMSKVAKNVEFLNAEWQRQENFDASHLEGRDTWRSVTVCIVLDGRTVANRSTLNYLHEIGLYEDEMMNITSIGIPVKMHMFEFTTMLVNAKGRTFNTPMQMVFALKEKNAGKLDSHRWFFQALCEQFDQYYCVLLDFGTLPTETAIYLLFRAMENNDDLAGVCGEVCVEQPFASLTNFVISAQNFEYKVSNMMDKALESVLGFITVLPGAFSAYRWEALEGKPLEAYFKSLGRSTFELGAFQGNMYLAEDRILCFELLAKTDCKWQMKYIKDALARTDVPEDAIALLLQRRRWLNGSFFATLYALLHAGRVFRDTKHSLLQKFFLGMNFAYMWFNLILSFLLLGNFFLVTEILLGEVDLNSSIPDDIAWMRPILAQVFSLTLLLYKATVTMLFLAALVVKPKEFKFLYNCICAFLGFVTVNVVCVAISSIETGNYVCLPSTIRTVPS
jgi:chitin synthase